MRIILFRGRRIDNGKWVYGTPLFDWADCSLKCPHHNKGELYSFFGWHDECHEFDEFEVDPATIGQYTGLDDKNGVKIFEGDILSYGGWKKKVYFSTYLRLPCFTIGIGGGSSTKEHPLILSNRYVVVGNQFDNPELLREAKSLP